MGGREDPIEILKNTEISLEGYIIQRQQGKSFDAYDLGGIIQDEKKVNRVNMDITLKKPLALHTYYTGVESDVLFFQRANKWENKDFNESKGYLKPNKFDKYFGGQYLTELKLKLKNNDKTLATATQVAKALRHVYKTCKEGFFINESISHLTYYFKLMNNTDPKFHQTNDFLKYLIDKPYVGDTIKNGNENRQVYGKYIDEKSLTIKTKDANRLGFVENTVSNLTKMESVIPMIMTGPFENSDKDNNKDFIGMLTSLPAIEKSEQDKFSKFVMFACIRQNDDANHIAFIKKTLEFAQSISSTKAV